MGLFSGHLFFEGAYYWREFCVSKWIGLAIKTAVKTLKENSLKQLKTATNPYSTWAYILDGLLSGGYLRLRFGGGGARFSGSLYLGVLIVITLR